MERSAAMNSFMRCVSRTARCAGLYRGEKLEPLGLNGCHHTYILAVCRNPGVSQEQLSRMIFINKSNVTRQLNFLEQNGFVTRTPDETDRRVLRVYPTQRALDAYPVVRQVLRDWQDYVTEGFTPEEREELTRLMERVADRAAAYAEGRLAPAGEGGGEK